MKRDAFAKEQSRAGKVLEEMQQALGGRRAFEEKVDKARYKNISVVMPDATYHALYFILCTCHSFLSHPAIR